MRSKSQKPDEIYEIIEMMKPGAKKLEIFARNHNLREGWLSLGNQLGENYKKFENNIDCDICHNLIPKGKKCYRSKYQSESHHCKPCLK
jgi:mRNA (2'-O-methyladenosine-N6-)-methyltransferase